MSFLLYESSSGKQVDGLPLASARADDSARRAIRKLTEPAGRSEGSATIDAHSRKTRRLMKSVSTCS